MKCLTKSKWSWGWQPAFQTTSYRDWIICWSSVSVYQIKLEVTMGIRIKRFVNFYPEWKTRYWNSESERTIKCWKPRLVEHWFLKGRDNSR